MRNYFSNLKDEDKKLFEETIISIKDQAYKVAYCYLYNQHDSMDAVCNAVEKALLNIGKLKNKKFFRTWFIRIVINECKLLMKTNKKVILIADSLYEQQITRENLDKEDSIDLLAAIKKLEPSERMLIFMKYYMGYTLEEISQIVKLPIGTIKTKVYNNLKNIKNRLREDGI